MADTLTSPFFQRLEELLCLHEFSAAVAMVGQADAPKGLSDDLAAVFKTAASNAMIFEEEFETLLPLLNWCVQQGADPFAWTSQMRNSVYEDALEHAWSTSGPSRPGRFSDAALLRWCWETPSAPALFEHSVTAQLEMDGAKCWFKSYSGRFLGSLSQLSGVAKNHVDWNRVWADGRSTVLMAVEMALNPLDLKRDENGKERYDGWEESFRGLRRLAKEIDPSSPEVASLFWLSEAWWLAMTGVADKRPYGTAGESRPAFWEKGNRAYGAFHKELQRRFPEDYRQRFEPEGRWAVWLQGRSGHGYQAAWTRITGWASALRGLENIQVGPPVRWASSESAQGLEGTSGKAVLHQLAVLQAAAPLLEGAGWQRGEKIPSAGDANQIWKAAWVGFAHHMATLTPQARQEVFSNPAVWWVAAPALENWFSVGITTELLQELVEQAPWPPPPTVRGLLEAHPPAEAIAAACRQRDLEVSLPAPARPRAMPRF